MINWRLKLCRALSETRLTDYMRQMMFIGQHKMTKSSLELNHLSLPLLVTSKLKVLATLQRDLLTDFAVRTFHPEHNLFSGLGLYNKKTP